MSISTALRAFLFGRNAPFMSLRAIFAKQSLIIEEIASSCQQAGTAKRSGAASQRHVKFLKSGVDGGAAYTTLKKLH